MREILKRVRFLSPTANIKNIMKNFFLLLLAAILFTACPPTEEKEVIIIGGGLAGSATAWQLAKAGKKVVLIEKQDSIYTSGSSKGKARIARSSNRGDDIWSYLHNRSVKEVEALIQYLNSADEETTYKMSDIYTTSPVTYVGRTKIYDKLYASLIRQKVDYKMATTPMKGKELFGVSLPDSVLIQREYNLHSGTINPERLIQYLHKAIQLKGGTIGYNWEVQDISKQEDRYLLNIAAPGRVPNSNKSLPSKNTNASAGSRCTVLSIDVLGASGSVLFLPCMVRIDPFTDENPRE